MITPVIGILLGCALYHTLSSMTFLELAIVMRFLSLATIIATIYVYLNTVMFGSFDVDVALIELADEADLETNPKSEVEEIAATPTPSPRSREESEEFRDLLAAEKNTKTD